MDDVPVKNISEWEKKFLKYIDDMKPEVFEELANAKDLTKTVEEKLKKTIEEFKSTYAKHS